MPVADMRRRSPTWSSPSDYDAQAKKLAVLFKENFVQFRDQSSKSVQEAGPRMG